MIRLTRDRPLYRYNDRWTRRDATRLSLFRRARACLSKPSGSPINDYRNSLLLHAPDVHGDTQHVAVHHVHTPEEIWSPISSGRVERAFDKARLTTGALSLLAFTTYAAARYGAVPRVFSGPRTHRQRLQRNETFTLVGGEAQLLSCFFEVSAILLILCNIGPH